MLPAIRRTTRRLRGGASAPAVGSAGVGPRPVGASVPAPLDGLEDVVIVLGRVEIALLLVALETALGDAVDRPNTPARLEQALLMLMADRGEPGHPHVLRRPALLSTPESWEIHLDGVERATGLAVREAGRSGAFAA